MDTKVFKEVNNCSIYADIYYHGSNSPVIIYIHGGGFIFGTRKMIPSEQIEYFYQAGFSIVNIDYRLAPETKLESMVEDVRDAFEWVRTKATEWYDFDINNIAVMGGSTGGYFSLLLGTMEIKPKAIVSFYGYGDILGEWGTKPSEYLCQNLEIVSKQNAYKLIEEREITDGKSERLNFIIYCFQHGVWVNEVTGFDPVNDRKQLIQYNPINNITAEFPPTLFLHGDQDKFNPYELSVMMYKKLQEHGVYAKLITIEGAGHAFDYNFDDQIQVFHDPMVKSAFQQVVDFLRTHLCK